MTGDRLRAVASAAVALAVTVATMGLIAGNPALDGGTDPDALSFALAGLSGLPLAFRHRAPLAVLAVTTAAAAALALFGYAPFAHLGPAVALATVASRGAPDDARWAAAIAAAGWLAIALSEIVVVEPHGDFLRSGVIWAGFWILGDRRRQSRERLAGLRERAERAERESEREQALAVAEERAHIGRELHDSAGHAINVILMQAGAARLWRERDPERTREALEAIEEVARETLTEIDGLVGALRGDGRADAAPLPGIDDLDALIDTHRSGGLAVTSRRDGRQRRVPPAVGRAAYRIAQEALTNAAKHGDGPAELVLEFRDDALELTVTNPAHCDDPPPRPAGGHGLIGMRERAALLGGRFEVGRAGDSFRVRARLPYDRPPR